MDQEWQIAILCERMGWTFKEYENQPQWFLEVLELKSRLEAEQQQAEAKKANHRS